MKKEYKHKIPINLVSREVMDEHESEMRAEMDEVYTQCLLRVGLSKHEAYKVVRARRERIGREEYDEPIN